MAKVLQPIKALGNLRSVYKRNARNRNLLWALTDAEFSDLVGGDCYYCGAPPSPQMRHSRGIKREAIEKLNGIDRLDASLGYIPSNCVPACKNCNLAKQSLSFQDFLVLVKKIYQRWF